MLLAVYSWTVHEVGFTLAYALYLTLAMIQCRLEWSGDMAYQAILASTASTVWVSFLIRRVKLKPWQWVEMYLEEMREDKFFHIGQAYSRLLRFHHDERYAMEAVMGLHDAYRELDVCIIAMAFLLLVTITRKVKTAQRSSSHNEGDGGNEKANDSDAAHDNLTSSFPETGNFFHIINPKRHVICICLFAVVAMVRLLDRTRSILAWLRFKGGYERIDIWMIEHYYLPCNKSLMFFMMITALLAVWMAFLMKLPAVDGNLGKTCPLYELVKPLPPDKKREALALMTCGLILWGCFFVLCDLEANDPYSALEIVPKTDFHKIKRAFRRLQTEYSTFWYE